MGKRNSCHPGKVEWLGQFRVYPSLCFKARLSAKQVIWKRVFILMKMRHYHKKVALGLVLKVTVFGTRKWPIEQWAYDELHCGIVVEKNNPGYLKMEFLVNYCSFWRLITNHDNVLLQFTTARIIKIDDNVLLQFTIAWLLQFSTTVITIYDMTTGITILNIITIHNRTYGTQYLLVQWSFSLQLINK